jgi:hypothetical protein
MLQFDRKATVIISSDGQTGLSTSGLRVVFDVKKTSTVDFNTANVSVYNLSETTRNQIKKLGGQITVKAGYSQDSGEQVIFVGDISMASSEIVKPEVVTKFEANDGEKRIHSKKLSVSYKAGTGGKQIVKDIISTTSFPLKNINWGSFSDKIYPRGFSFAGSAKVLMTNVCNYLGLEWSIQNNEIKLIKSGTSDGAQIIFLSPSSGIIGSPVRVKDVGTKDKKDDAIEGWKVSCLLQPLAEPGGVIKIKSAEVVEGLYRIVDVQHSGDTHGGDWKSIITVSAL